MFAQAIFAHPKFANTIFASANNVKQGDLARSVAAADVLMHAAVMNRPDVLSDESGLFTDEVARLVVGYPRGP